MLIKDMKYSYNDITIVPAPITTVEHRADCNPYLNDGMLPIFTAPMSSVVSEENFDLFESNKINAILPRSYSFDKRKEFALKGKWAAFSLQEFESNFLEKFENRSRDNLVIAMGCTGGQHRSVFFAEKVGEFLKEAGYLYTVNHNDIWRGGQR